MYDHILRRRIKHFCRYSLEALLQLIKTSYQR